MNIHDLNDLKTDKRILSFLESHLASEYHKRIMDIVSDTEKEINNNEQIIVSVSDCFGNTVNAEFIGYYNPNIIFINGIDQDGKKTKLVVPYTSISIAISIHNIESNKQRHQIGFQSHDKHDQ